MEFLRPSAVTASPGSRATSRCRPRPTSSGGPGTGRCHREAASGGSTGAGGPADRQAEGEHDAHPVGRSNAVDRAIFAWHRDHIAQSTLLPKPVRVVSGAEATALGGHGEFALVAVRSPTGASAWTEVDVAPGAPGTMRSSSWKSAARSRRWPRFWRASSRAGGWGNRATLPRAPRVRACR
jgi:hypothetical protein